MCIPSSELERPIFRQRVCSQRSHLISVVIHCIFVSNPQHQDSHPRDLTHGPSQPQPRNTHWDTLIKSAERAPKEPEKHARTYFDPTLFPDLHASNTAISPPSHPSGRAEPLSSRGSELIMQIEELGRAVQYSSPYFFLANHGAILALQEKMEKFLVFCVVDDADVRGDEWFVRLSRLVARQRRVLQSISSRVSSADFRVNGNWNVYGNGSQPQPQPHSQRAVPGGFAHGGNAAFVGRSNGPVRGTSEQASKQRRAIPLPARRIVAGTSGSIGTARYHVEL
ncbi:hypothetical protein BDV19DRAFT_234888 [Aspergillus venezuelensis]